MDKDEMLLKLFITLCAKGKGPGAGDLASVGMGFPGGGGNGTCSFILRSRRGARTGPPAPLRNPRRKMKRK